MKRSSFALCCLGYKTRFPGQDKCFQYQLVEWFYYASSFQPLHSDLLRIGLMCDFPNTPLCVKHYASAAHWLHKQILETSDQKPGLGKCNRGVLPNGVLSLLLQLSSICRAAVHAGVVRNNGGYVDIMPVDKRKMYTASFQNGIFSER